MAAWGTDGITEESLRAMSRLVLSLVLHVGPADGPSALEPMGRLDVRLVPEASGIVKSRRHPGVFWVHNDSGNPPSLFAIRADGRIVREFRLAVPNIDWEDIAIDDHGHLYLGDIGNNLGALPIRAIYRIDEPDPAPTGRTAAQAARPSRAMPFPRGNRFDAESLDFDKANAIVIAKYLDGREAEVFSVPFDPPPPLSKPAQPRSLGRLAGFTEPATGSDLDVDRTHLAVCSSTVTRIYRREDVRTPDWKLVERSALSRSADRRHLLGRPRPGPGRRGGCDLRESPRRPGAIATPRHSSALPERNRRRRSTERSARKAP